MLSDQIPVAHRAQRELPDTVGYADRLRLRLGHDLARSAKSAARLRQTAVPSGRDRAAIPSLGFWHRTLAPAHASGHIIDSRRCSDLPAGHASSGSTRARPVRQIRMPSVLHTSARFQSPSLPSARALMEGARALIGASDVRHSGGDQSQHVGRGTAMLVVGLATAATLLSASVYG